MSLRTCPSCNTNLKPEDHFFCSNCGKKLPEEVSSYPLHTKVVSRTSGSNAPSFNFSKVLSHYYNILSQIVSHHKVGAILVTILIVNNILLVSVFIRYQRLKSYNEQQVTIVHTGNVLKTKLPLEQGSFGTDLIYNLAPSDVDVFIEGTDFGGLSDNYLETTQSSKEPALYIKEHSANHFVLFGRESNIQEESWEWALVTTFSGDIEGGDLFSMLSVDPLKVGDFAVFSNSQELTKDIRDAKEGKIKSLALNPDFASKKKSMEKQGLFLIYAPNRSGLANLKQNLSWLELFGLEAIVDDIINTGFTDLVVRE